MLLEADPELLLLPESVGNLLGAPLLHEQRIDPCVLPIGVMRSATTSSQPAVAMFLCLARTIGQAAAYLGAVALVFPIDRAGMAAENPGDLGHLIPGFA